MKLYELSVVLPLISLVQAVTIQEVPICAQTCLANSTQAQTTCQVIDVACLCTNTAYVSTLSCCLATSCTPEEQSTAIQFNQEECAKVGKQAPAFVGCSPLNVTNLPTGPAGNPTTLKTQTSANLQVSTISGPIVTEPASFTGATNTATFAGAPLLTGTCSNPFFAVVTAAAGDAMEFPAVGCGPERPNCCPFPYGSNGRISRCPQDYFTTSGGCCPLGYQVYYTGIGAQTPCYSVPSSTLVPATTPTDTARLTLISQTVFAQKFELVQEQDGGKLTGGALIGVIVGPVAAVLLLTNIIIFCLWQKRKIRKREAELNRATTFPPMEPMITSSEVPQTPHELASPDMIRSPRSPQMGQLNKWISSPASSPPAYDSQRDLGMMSPTKLQIPQDPQELEGSSFIHQHHPAFGTDLAGASGTPTTAASPSERPQTPRTPRTPVRSPGGSDRESPMITPSSGMGNTPRSLPSPPNSPRQIPGRLV